MRRLSLVMVVGALATACGDNQAVTGGPDSGTGTGDGAVVTGDGSSTDTGAMTGDTGAMIGDTGAMTEDTGAMTGDTGAMTGDTGTMTGDTGAMTGDTGAMTGDGGEQCVTEATRLCYTGPDGTDGVGRCRGGTQVCGSDRTWSVCTGEIVPAAMETCRNGIDDDCNGRPDDGCDACNLGESRPC